MKLSEKVLEKIINSKIEVEEIEREIYNSEKDDYQTELINVVKFPCGRDFQNLIFSNKIEENTYLESNFEKYKFIQDYEAIWSTDLKIIECELTTTTRLGPPSRFLLRRLARSFGESPQGLDENKRFEFESSDQGYLISIGYTSIDYAILTFAKDRVPRFEFAKRRPTIRIENIELKTHDEAKRILEKIGHALLFKLDITLNLGYKLAADRDIRRNFSRKKSIEESIDKSFPNYEYDNEPMSLYWYAQSATDMPLLRFLALYQILEFYFPIFSQKDAHYNIKNIIKDPRFNPNKDSDITKILNSITKNKNQIGFGSELEQLKSTTKACLTSEEIRELLNEDEDLLEFYKNKKSRKLSIKDLNLANTNADLVSEVSERIYEIRCRVVHTKTSEKNYELLLPSSPELKDLIYDTAILEMISKKVLIASSRIMRI